MELNIGQKIMAMRLASDLTQEELAIRAGLTKGFISQLENDQTSIQIDSLADIVEVFGMTMSEFFFAFFEGMGHSVPRMGILPSEPIIPRDYDKPHLSRES